MVASFLLYKSYPPSPTGSNNILVLEFMKIEAYVEALKVEHDWNYLFISDYRNKYSA